LIGWVKEGQEHHYQKWFRATSSVRIFQVLFDLNSICYCIAYGVKFLTQAALKLLTDENLYQKYGLQKM